MKIWNSVISKLWPHCIYEIFLPQQIFLLSKWWWPWLMWPLQMRNWLRWFYLVIPLLLNQEAIKGQVLNYNYWWPFWQVSLDLEGLVFGQQAGLGCCWQLLVNALRFHSILKKKNLSWTLEKGQRSKLSNICSLTFTKINCKKLKLKTFPINNVDSRHFTQFINIFRKIFLKKKKYLKIFWIFFCFE